MIKRSVRLSRLTGTALGLVTLTAVALAQTPSADTREAARMQQSLTAIVTRGATPPTKGKKPLPPLRTSFTDGQLNAWLATDGKAQLPAGVVNPRVSFSAPGTLTLNAVVDLDALRKAKERGWLDPLAYLNGYMALALEGTFAGAGGQGTFDVVSASLGNVSVPRLFLQELIAYYSKSSDFPNGVVLAKPFPLPAGVRDVIIQRGSATVVQ